jgi:hypothetical protein
MPSKQDLQPLLNARQNQLNLIFSYAEALDTKNLAILAANIAVLLFAAQVWPDGQLFLGVGVFGTYLVSTLINIVGIVSFADYTGASVDLDEHPEYMTMTEDDLVLQLLADTQGAIVHNRKLNYMKLRLCLASLAFSTIGTFLLIWGILKA